MLSIIAAASAIYTDYGTNKINLVIKTNGTDTYITNESKLSGPKSQEMMQDIKENVITDVASSNSTDESIKSDVKISHLSMITMQMLRLFHNLEQISSHYL